MDGLELAARFALPSARRSYCGPNNAAQVLESYLSGINATSREKTESMLKIFEAQPHFLNAIAAANSMSPYDEKVVEAYVFGNELVDNVTLAHISEHILKPFAARGLPQKNLRNYEVAFSTRGACATHTFDVLLNTTNDSLPAPLRVAAESCQVSSGPVVKINQQGPITVIGGWTYDERQGKLVRVLREVQGKYNPRFTPKVKIGDTVAVHHGEIFAVLDEKQELGIVSYSARAARTINEILSASRQVRDGTE